MLLAWGDGDRAAFERLAEVVYKELRKVAGRLTSQERSDHTLQAPALENEAYMRLVDINRVQWQNGAHFFAMSARLMRRILVVRRGRDVIALDDALTELAKTDERKSNVVKMRFFGGLSVEETLMQQLMPR